MYVPSHFAELDPEVLRDAMARFPLATLVSLGREGLVSTHLPMLYDPEPGPYGTLTGHIARANPQWQDLDSHVDALAIFSGPDAYITPSWYDAKREGGKVVPTWDYVAVHAYGPLHAFEDRERMRALVTRLTTLHEAKFPSPWTVQDAPTQCIDAMLGAIVGLELPIRWLVGKWKMSQNRPEADRTRVEQGLLASNAERDRETGEEMQRFRTQRLHRHRLP